MKVCLLLVFIPNQAEAQTASVATPSTEITKEPENATRSAVLLYRLEQIKAMDKSGLSSLEKKELRKEVKAIKSEFKATSGGVYLSVGAILIIILLLILLL